MCNGRRKPETRPQARGGGLPLECTAVSWLSTRASGCSIRSSRNVSMSCGLHKSRQSGRVFSLQRPGFVQTAGCRSVCPSRRVPSQRTSGVHASISAAQLRPRLTYPRASTLFSFYFETFLMEPKRRTQITLTPSEKLSKTKNEEIPQRAAIHAQHLRHLVGNRSLTRHSCPRDLYVFESPVLLVPITLLYRYLRFVFFVDGDRERRKDRRTNIITCGFGMVEVTTI